MNLQQEAVEFLLERTGYLTWIDGLKDKQRYLGHVEMLHQSRKWSMIMRDQEYTLFDIATNTFDMASSVKKNIEGVTITAFMEPRFRMEGCILSVWKTVYLQCAITTKNTR